MVAEKWSPGKKLSCLHQRPTDKKTPSLHPSRFFVLNTQSNMIRNQIGFKGQSHLVGVPGLKYTRNFKKY